MSRERRWTASTSPQPPSTRRPSTGAATWSAASAPSSALATWERACFCCPSWPCPATDAQDAFHGAHVERRSWRSARPLDGELRGHGRRRRPPRPASGRALQLRRAHRRRQARGLAAKQHLAGDGIHYEPRWFRPGRRRRAPAWTPAGCPIPHRLRVDRARWASSSSTWAATVSGSRSARTRGSPTGRACSRVPRRRRGPQPRARVTSPSASATGASASCATRAARGTRLRRATSSGTRPGARSTTAAPTWPSTERSRRRPRASASRTSRWPIRASTSRSSAAVYRRTVSAPSRSRIRTGCSWRSTSRGAGRRIPWASGSAVRLGERARRLGARLRGVHPRRGRRAFDYMRKARSRGYVVSLSGARTGVLRDAGGADGGPRLACLGADRVRGPARPRSRGPSRRTGPDLRVPAHGEQRRGHARRMPTRSPLPWGPASRPRRPADAGRVPRGDRGGTGPRPLLGGGRPHAPKPPVRDAQPIDLGAGERWAARC